MAKQAYDLIVIGAGAAGSTAATTAASSGKRVALIERHKIGGTCLNYGCDPTKTLIHTARQLYHTRQAGRFGLRCAGESADWPAVMSWVQSVVNQIRGGSSEEAAEKLGKQGIAVYMDQASFISPHELSLDNTILTAERIIIATGGKELIPPIEGLNEAGFITNVEAVALETLPRSMAIVGGGAIGMEFAQMFHRFGVQVTVLERSPLLLDKEDREMADTLCDLLRGEGLHLETDAVLKRVRRDARGKCLTIQCGKRAEEEVIVDEILLAVGRRPALETLRLEKAGVQTGKKGIDVDAALRTSMPHIWAAGDVTGGLQFTHVAYEQGKLAGQNAFAQQPRPFERQVIPWVTFTDPPLAHVGKTEEQVKQENIQYRVGRMYFKDVERAVAEGETEGLVKLIVDSSGAILGGHVLTADGDDLLAPIILAMQTHTPVETLAATIMPYPTLSEGVRWAADKLRQD